MGAEVVGTLNQVAYKVGGPGVMSVGSFATVLSCSAAVGSGDQQVASRTLLVCSYGWGWWGYGRGD